MGKRIKNCISNEEIQRAIKNHADLRVALEENLSQSLDLIKAIFSKLVLKNNSFKTFDAARSTEIKIYKFFFSVMTA